MKTYAIGTLSLACVLVLAGCDDKKSGTGTAPSATTSGTVAPQTVPSASVTAVATAAPMPTTEAFTGPLPDVSVEEDFFEESEKEITKDNMDAELAKLEKEIGPAAK